MMHTGIIASGVTKLFSQNTIRLPKGNMDME